METIQISTTPEGIFHKMRKSYTDIYDAIREDVVNAFEENAEIIDINIEIKNGSSYVTVIGGQNPLTHEKLNIWFTSTKLNSFDVGQMGEARWAVFAFGVKKKVYEQQDKKFVLHDFSCDLPVKTDYNEKETRTTYIIPEKIDIEMLKTELEMTFALLLRNEYNIMVNGEKLNWKSILPTWKPICEDEVLIYNKPFLVIGWYVQNTDKEADYYFDSPFPQPFLGLRGALKGITIQYERMGMTDRTNHLFGFVVDIEGREFSPQVNNQKTGLISSPRINHIIHEVRKHLRKYKEFNPKPLTTSETFKELLKFLPNVFISPRKCPKCGSTKLKSDGKRYICQKCGHTFFKKWSKKRKDYSKKGMKTTNPLTQGIEGEEGYWENEGFLVPNIDPNRPNVWGINVKANEEGHYKYPKLKYEYDRFSKNQTANNARTLIPILVRVRLKKKFIEKNEETLRDEWVQLDNLLDNALKGKILDVET
jgi:ribosomal protein S27AE